MSQGNGRLPGQRIVLPPRWLASHAARVRFLLAAGLLASPLLLPRGALAQGSTPGQSQGAPRTPAPLPTPQDFFASPPTSSPGGRGAPAEGTSPEPSSSRDDTLYSVRGLKTWYAQFDSGFGIDEVSRCDPGAEDCSKPITESRYNLLLAGLVGWGPLRTDNFFFNLHYKYSHNWSTDYAQAERFLDKWFSNRKAENFLFPTKSMLRTHEVASDLRYLASPFQAGLFTRFSIGRLGSKTFGEELEEAETVVKSENFVPYVSYKYDRYYRGQLSMPFRTEINVDDPRLSNATYSWKSEGRGRAFSFKLSNGVYIPPLDSLLYIDISQLQTKYASIQNDRTRTGVSSSFDFPVIWNLRVSPRAVYYKEKFLVDRVRIPGYKKSTAGKLVAEPAKEFPREDTYLSFGLYTYWDFSRSSRIDFSILRETTTSTITEFNVVRNVLLMGYSYSWPSTNVVVKRVDRFSESPYAEEF